VLVVKPGAKLVIFCELAKF